MTYYLFPREISVSPDQPARQTKDGFLGRTVESDQEILAMGFDARIDVAPDGSHAKLKLLRNLSFKKPVNPEWFDSNTDTALAFLLPLLTALAGMWLFRFLFSTLSVRMPLPEQLAYGLGMGMMAVAALTLGVKLCGFSGRGLIFLVTALGAVAEIWRHWKVYGTSFTGGFWKLVRSPVGLVIGVVGLLVFLTLFRLAGLQGLVGIRCGHGVGAQGQDHCTSTAGTNWCNGFRIRDWRMRIWTIRRSCPRCMPRRMTRLVTWMNLSPSSGPPGCCCSCWPHWPR